MSAAYRFLTRPEVEALLSDYGGHVVESEPQLGVEIWSTAWGAEFSFTLELDGVTYDEWQVISAIETAIKPSLPKDWLLTAKA